MYKYLLLLLLAPVTALADFTPIQPSEDSRLIYVSSSEGSDSNDCLSAAKPCASIGASLSKMRSGYPDHVYLKRGDTWRGESLSAALQGRSSSEPAVIAFYGDSGPRPIIENAGKSAIHLIGQRLFKDVHIIGLHFYAYKKDPSHPEFTGLSTDDSNISMLGGNENVLFEDNIFDLMATNMQAWDGDNPKNMTFNRNIWTGAYYNNSANDRHDRPSNMYADAVDGLVLTQNVVDHGGWHSTVPGAAANMFNHNLYLQTGNVGNRVAVRENIITRGAASGIQMRAGGIAENNFFAKNAAALSFGYKPDPITSGAMAHAFNNVVTEGHSMAKGVGACSNRNLCTPALWGIIAGVTDRGNADLQLRGNLVHSHAADDTKWEQLYSELNAKSLGEQVIGWEQGVHNAGRTLADYNAALGGERDFDAFMGKALSRGLQEWPVELSTAAINDFIREGAVQPQRPEPPVAVLPEPEPEPVVLPPLRYACEMTCTAK